MVTDFETDMSMRRKEAIVDICDLDLANIFIQESDATSTCDGLSRRGSSSTGMDFDDHEFSVMDLCQSVEPASDDFKQDKFGLPVPPGLPVPTGLPVPQGLPVPTGLPGSIPQTTPAGVGQLVAERASSRLYEAHDPSRCADMGCMSRASNQKCTRCGHKCESQAKFCVNCGTKRDVTLGVTESVERGGHAPTQVAIPAAVSRPPGRWNIQSDSREPVAVYTTPGCTPPCAEVSQVPPLAASNNVPSSLRELPPFQPKANHQGLQDYPVGAKAPLKVSLWERTHTLKPLDTTIPTKKKPPSWTERPISSVLDWQALCPIHHQAFASRYSPPNFDRDHQPCIQQ